MAAEENDKLDSSGKVVKLSQSILESVGPYLEYAPDGVYISDLKGTFLYGNRKAEEIIKYSREELIGQSYLKKNLLPANELVKAARLLARNALGKPTGPDEFELTGKDGSRVWAEINTVHIVQKGEKLVLAFVRDITERKKMEKSLQQTETRFKELFENISNGVAVYKAVDDGQDFIFIDFNKAGEKIEYLKKEDVVGQSVQAVFPGIKEFGLLDVFKRVWKTGKPEHHPVTLYQDKRIISWRENYIYKLPSGEIVAVYEDITERINQENEMNRIEQQYRQVQRLESIGRLAGGVAHDLNNMLTPILGYSELLLAKTASDDKNREPLEEIVKASNRASTLVRQLLAFSRRQTLEFTNINLNTLLKDFQNLLRSTIREDINIRLIADSTLPVIKGDIGQLEQVILNLAVNAQDAMPDGGDLIIETSMAELDKSYAVEHNGVVPGRYVMMAVSDTGHGMDIDTIEHIFEPFFTTKGIEQGTGLGLSISYGIVKQHGGNIWAYSEKGMGTTFKVYLPVPEGILFEQEIKKKTAVDSSGTETILLVEDEENVRKLARTILENKGYNVIVAQSGAEALLALKEHHSSLDLMLTDVIMPDMNGRELFNRITKEYPELKVLYMSGYTDDVIAHHGVLEEGTSFIQKPFNVRDLTTKIRELLD